VGISFNTIWASTNSGITWFSNSVPGVSAFISVTFRQMEPNWWLWKV
jgi:hypothetical protein